MRLSHRPSNPVRSAYAGDTSQVNASEVTSRVTDGQAKNQVEGANERNSELILIIYSPKQ